MPVLCLQFLPLSLLFLSPPPLLAFLLLLLAAFWTLVSLHSPPHTSICFITRKAGINRLIVRLEKMGGGGGGGVSNQSGCILCAGVCHSSMFVHILTPCLILLHKLHLSFFSLSPPHFSPSCIIVQYFLPLPCPAMLIAFELVIFFQKTASQINAKTASSHHRIQIPHFLIPLISSLLLSVHFSPPVLELRVLFLFAV